MANKIQLKRGLKSKLPTLSQGEPAYTTDTRELYVGTGSGNVKMSGGMWFTGTGMSGTSTSTTYGYSACPQVKVGDMFLNTTYGYIYQCTTAGSGTTARWTYQGCIMGATGATGPTGAAGANGRDADISAVMNIMAKISDANILEGFDVENVALLMPPRSEAKGKTYFVTKATETYDNGIYDAGFYGSMYNTSGGSANVLKGECALLRVNSDYSITVLEKW